MKYDTNYFLNKIKGKYSDIDYSEVFYDGKYSKVKLRCTRHNLTYYQRASDHYEYKGCKLCRSENRLIKLEDWKTNSSLKYNNKYIYDAVNESNFIYGKNVLINCPLHGDYETNSLNHMLGKGNCKVCVGKERKSKEQLIFEMNQKHNNMYDYEFPEKWTMQTKIKIACKKHGIFNSCLKSHLNNGSKCPKCSLENNGWSKSKFIKSSNGRKCIFYVLLCYDEKEYFYKIGITSKSIKDRYPNEKKMPYDYIVLQTINGTAESVWEIEKANLNHLKMYHYNPLMAFKGSVKECFKL